MAKKKVGPKRQFPTPSSIGPLLKFRKPTLSAKKRRLAKAQTIWDLRKIAKKRTPKGPFDYTDGAAEEELSLARARRAFQNVEFHPAILRDVSKLDTTTTVFGQTFALPFGIAPTGFTRMMQTEGEYAGASAAAAAGIPFTLSTMGTTTPEKVAEASGPEGTNWFQLYMQNDREKSMALVERAKNSGFTNLIITVDVPIAGARLRDNYNGMTIPPSLTLGTIFDAIPRPAWWWNLLTTEPLEFSNLGSWDGPVADLLDALFDPTMTFEDLKWIREQWDGPVVIKGIQTLEDAKACVDFGIDGIVLSNHGGRQLDRAPIPFHLLPEVAREVGKDTTIILDTGIMHGADIVASLALGADFTLIGRSYLYGLMAGGRAGVDRTIEILSTQLRRVMKLLGVASVEELEPKHVTQMFEFYKR